MRLTPGHPVETTIPRLVVDAGLAIGRHRFQLVVVNRRGQRSQPADVVIEISRQTKLTEDDVVRIVRAYIEGLFPKVCPRCGLRFGSLRDYLQQTTHLGSPIFNDEIGGQPLAEPLGPISLANCRCGTTLTISSEGIPRELMAELVAWARGEASRRSVTVPDVLHALRERIDAQVLGEDEGRSG